MSGKYFGMEGDVPPMSPFTKVVSEVNRKINEELRTQSVSQDVKLHELGEQLDVAQDRCNLLIDQLDTWKNMCKGQLVKKSRMLSNLTPGSKSFVPPSVMEDFSDKDKPEYESPKSAVTAIGNILDDVNDSINKLSSNYQNDPLKQTRRSMTSLEASPEQNVSIRTLLKRQNSTAIATDNTGAAVKTINHILNGIANSVNKIALHSNKKSPRNVTTCSIGVSPRPVTDVDVKNSQLISYQPMQPKKLPISDDGSGLINEITMDRSIISIKSKINKKKLNRRSSFQGNKRSVRNAIKYNIENCATKTTIIDKASSTLTTKKRNLKRLKPSSKVAAYNKKSSLVIHGSKIMRNSSNDNLVEIYHNVAAKGSDSDEANGQKASKTDTKKRDLQIPPLHIPERSQQTVESENKSEIPRRKSSVLYADPDALNSEMSFYSKRYTLPTIASRMKKVTKSYFNAFNFKAIPFCVALSTSPSHNIGINIQQFMNILKTRQPVQGISPTLAHNIGLAAERLNGKPLSSLVSVMASRIGSKCPLSKSNINYHHLQEMAKVMPEDTIIECDEDALDSPTVRTVVITGPSGEVEVQNPKVTVWGVSSSSGKDTCTCVPREGVGLQQVVNKYSQLDGTTTTLNNQYNVNPSKKNVRPKKVNKKKLLNADDQVHTSVVQNHEDTVATISKHSALSGREKNLKDVLTNLHNEFESMNTAYEELSLKVGTKDETEDLIKELQQKEQQLNNKENEINMVMALYKEVLALKQQVKTLKQRTITSQASVATVKDSMNKFGEYNNPQAAFHLTKLLRQLQHYQMHLKKEGPPLY